MSSGNHVVVDVSSDEEIDSSDCFSWLNEVMKSVDEKSDSADEVEVVSEVKGGVASEYRKSNSLKNHRVEDEDDADCVILDGDPDKSSAKTSVVDDDEVVENDDVLVVGQKGEIACRDFPHPRHSCAKYAFNSTLHDKYCDMCHCYVCDIRAPCPYWCIGDSTIDHCHANDKEEIWKNQREYFRTGKMPCQLPTTKPSIPSQVSSTISRQFPRTSPQNIIRLSQNSLPRNQIGIQPCSSSTYLATNPRSRFRFMGQSPNGLQHRPLQSLTSVRNNTIHKDRRTCIANISSRMASPGSLSGTRYIKSPIPTTITPEMYTRQQRSPQAYGSDHNAGVSASQSTVYTKHSSQNISGQLQTAGDLFGSFETRNPVADTQSQTKVQQQPKATTTDNVIPNRLSEFEEWLMDISNQTGLVCSSPEPVNEEYGTFTFDFETFLND